jgi:integrase
MSEIDPETPPLAPDAVPAQPPILAKIAEPAARHLAHTTAPTAADYARRALAPSTIKRYAADWDDFLGFCRATGRQALPAAASTVADYLASLARSHSRSALRRRLSAIAQAHKLKNIAWAPDPLIRRTLRGILRQHGTPPRPAAALTTAEIKTLLATCDRSLAGIRDKAMLLVCYAGGLRRSELVAIEREHVSISTDGMRIHLPRSKTDPGGEGVQVFITKGERRETCPVKALEDWLAVSRTAFGPVFRKVDKWGGINHRGLHPDAVRQILRRHVAAAGLSVGTLARLSPHGLRAGCATQAYLNGADDDSIMRHLRHKSLLTTRGYVRRAQLMTESPSKKLGL